MNTSESLRPSNESIMRHIIAKNLEMTHTVTRKEHKGIAAVEGAIRNFHFGRVRRNRAPDT